MQGIAETVKNTARRLLADKTAIRIVGWEPGEFIYDPTPAVFDNPESLEKLTYNDFCGTNLSKYMIRFAKGQRWFESTSLNKLVPEAPRPGKSVVFLKPCDSYSLGQLIREHRLEREHIYIVGVPCPGMLDIEKLRALGIKGVRGVRADGENLTVDTMYGEKSCRREDVLLDKCLCCKGKTHVIADEVIEPDWTETPVEADRFAKVAELEALPPAERFEFWRGELSRCIRCNACRNVCPACSCLQCVFDNPRSGVAAKANSDPAEENLFHMIRAFHVAGRCTDCGECSRVCPQHIPLHLLNRRMIKDINEFYGEYQAGADLDTPSPLTNYTKEDVEPGIVAERSTK
jgi:ferredoxin